jgi:hypothetical protein
MISLKSLSRLCLAWVCFLVCDIEDVHSQNERWQTVLRFDSLSGGGMIVRGDTIIFRYSVEDERFGLYSTNAGESWEEEYKAEEIWQRFYFPNSPRMFGIVIRNEVELKALVLSANRVEHVTPLPEIAVNLREAGYSPYIKFNPVNDDEIILVMERDGPATTKSLAWQSRDAGRTWRMLEMPFAPAGASEFEFIFDYCNQQHWFVAVHGDHISYGLSLYETTDGGTSFTYKRLLNYGNDEYFNQAGIEGENFIRYLSYDRGLMTMDVESGKRDTISWLKVIKPEALASNIDQGIEHFLGEFSTNTRQASVSTVHRSEYLFPPGGSTADTIYNTEHDLSLTTDNGVTWQKLWSGFPCSRVVLDPDLKYVWIVTMDSILPFFYPGFLTSKIPHTLRKLDLRSFLSSREDAKLEEFSCFPNPTAERLSLKFSPRHPSKLVVRLLDYLGREQQVWNTPHLGSGSNRIEVHVPSHLTRGVYLLMVSAEGFNATQKIVLE